MLIKIIHRWRRQLFFMCIGSLIGQNIWRLPLEVQLVFLGLLIGLVFGCGITIIFYIRKGFLR